MARKLILNERDRVKREMEYLKVILQTLQDDTDEFEAGKSVLRTYVEQLKEGIDALNRRWSELSQVGVRQEEADFIREMSASIPKPSL